MNHHPGRLAMGADEAQAAEQVQRVGQQRAQRILHTQTVLQEHHLRPRRGDLGEQWRQLAIAGGLGADQQPVTGRHLRRILPGVDLGQMQLAKLGMAHLQPLAGHRRVFAA
ncbi:hypothetical protein D3C80_1801960 [compost metagenome]